MVCCVVIAMLFALPFIVARGVYGTLSGNSNCSMAWRPVATGSQNIEIISESRVSTPLGISPEFTISGRLKSFGHAGRGAVRLLRFEHSAWIQMTIGASAILLAIALNISASDWRWIVVAIGLVLSVEGLNTAVESTCDRISLAYSEQIKVAKDVAAGAVLLSSMAAALIGILTFWPYLFAADKAQRNVPDVLSSVSRLHHHSLNCTDDCRSNYSSMAVLQRFQPATDSIGS